MKNRTFSIGTGKFKCVEPYSENGIELVKGKTYEVYSYDSRFVYIWGIKNAKFSHLFPRLHRGQLPRHPSHSPWNLPRMHEGTPLQGISW